jgi:hypothetical protein
MEMEKIRGKIPAVTIVMCSLWIGVFSLTLDAVANGATMYELTVTVVSGHGTVEPNSGSYSAGTVVTLTATPEVGYYMRQWTGTDDDTSCGLTNTVTMDSDKTVTVEFGQPRVIVVGSEPNFVTIQQAIDSSNDGDTIIVNEGTYTGPGNRDIDFRGKAITVQSADPGDPNTVAMTIIECGGSEGENHRGFYFHSGEDSNSILDGLTIINGYVYGYTPNWHEGSGGAISCNQSNPTIRNCILRDNYADPWGGGIGLQRCSPRIENCTIIGNYGDSRGGGIRCGHDCSPTIVNCRIIGNACRNSGGGIDMGEEGSPIIRGCVISNNSNGAIRCRYSSPLIENCIITGNESHAILLAMSSSVINNCTIAHNAGRAIENSSGYTPTITNSILWGNDYAVARTADITYSNVEGGWQGQGNISIDPQFVNAAADDYHLQPLSPCIDAGDNSVVTVTTDLDGNPRIRGKAVDMGAYESLYYHVDGINGDNGNDGLSRETAFETIQFAIDEVNDSDTILVWPGVYNETATNGINFMGKAITVKSAADAAVLEVPGFTAVSFVQGEDENSVFSNFVVRGSSTGIFVLFANPTINNVTVVGNDNGVIADNAAPLITNSIFWNNTNGDLFSSPDPITAQYSFIQDEIEANLTAYYSFDNPNDPVHDDSGNEHDGIIYGPNWVTGQVGGALSFDGVDDYVDCGTPFASVTTSTTKSIIAWVKSADGMFANILILYRKSDIGTCFSITVQSIPIVWSGVYMKSATTVGLLDSESPVVMNKWTHIALVQDGTNVDIYVNGVSENNSSDAVAPALSNPPNATIGTYFYGGPTSFFNGTIDDVRIYNRALSAEEIQAIYEAGLAGLSYDETGFVDANGGDYHLLSERGRYRATTDEWILDEVTSPCVDGGDPSVNPSNERMPNGGRINMGAYGNTAYASMSEWPIKSDVNNDGRFNFMDIAILLDGWLQELPWAQ